MARRPDYGLIADRGQTIANGIQNAFNIMAKATSSGIQEYKAKRTNENAYKHVRKYVIDNQERFGLSDSEADAMAQKLKFKEGEAVENYEKRIAPTMSNMMVWDNYTKDPEYKVDLPDPFMKSDVFISSLENSQDRKKLKEIGNAVQDEVLGGGLAAGTDISNMQEEMSQQDPSQYKQPMSREGLPKTQEEATQGIGGRLGGGQPVSDKDLQQFPAFRGLPTEAGQAAGRQAGATLEKTQAQTEASQALTKQRNTSEELDRLKNAKNKTSAVADLKDLNTITRLELTAKESLKDVPKYGLEPGQFGEMVPKTSGTISEEWLDMKEISDMLKEKRAIVSKGKPQIQEADKPSREATIEADKITQEVLEQFPTVDSQDVLTEKIKFTADRINQFAKIRGVSNLSYMGIIDALRQGSTEADILERVISASQKQPNKQTPSPNQSVGGRLGR